MNNKEKKLLLEKEKKHMHCLNIFLIYALEHHPDNYKMFWCCVKQ